MARSKKPKKRVEYRWFPATPDCGLLGGIVAASLEDAERWASTEQGRHDKRRMLVRVRLEYEIPAPTQEGNAK